MRLPTTPDERLFAEDALRFADQEMDLAFAQAVRQTANQTAAAVARGEGDRREAAAGAARARRRRDAGQGADGGRRQGDVRRTRNRLTDRLNLAKAQARARSGRSRRRAPGSASRRRRSAGTDAGDDRRARRRVAQLRQRPRHRHAGQSTTRGLVRRVQALQALYAQGGAARTGEGRGRLAGRRVQEATRPHGGAGRRAPARLGRREAQPRFLGGAARADAAQRTGREGQGDARSARRQSAPAVRRLHRMDRGRDRAGARGRQPRAARPRGHSRHRPHRHFCSPAGSSTSSAPRRWTGGARRRSTW